MMCLQYDNNISPSLLMIIIKIIIRYFIQIRHTDDFLPTGTPASIDIIIQNAMLNETHTTVPTVYAIFSKILKCK